MARRPLFTADSILDAAQELVHENGPAVPPSVADIAHRAGASSGSVYHRFSSGSALLTALWLRSVRRFHQDYLAAGNCAADDPGGAQRALLSMAIAVVAHARNHPANAACMMLFRQSRLLDLAPDAQRDAVEHVNDGVQQRLRELCVQRYGGADRLELVRTAAVTLPYGLVRPYVGGSVPQELDDIVRAASAAVLALGDGANG